MLQLLELAFGLFLCYGGINAFYEAWQAGLEVTSFFAIGLSVFLLMGGISISILAIRRLRKKSGD